MASKDSLCKAWWPELLPCNPHGGRREEIPTGCPLVPTYASQYMHHGACTPTNKCETITREKKKHWSGGMGNREMQCFQFWMLGYLMWNPLTVNFLTFYNGVCTSAETNHWQPFQNLTCIAITELLMSTCQHPLNTLLHSLTDDTQQSWTTEPDRPEIEISDSA